MDIIYLRVSTNEKRQDLNQQLKAILDKYELKDYTVFKDEGSAYQLDKISKRIEFLKMLDIIFDMNYTIMDLFLKPRAKRDPVYLYVWDLSRIMRDLYKNDLFYLLCKTFNVKVVSHKDNKIYNEKDFDDPTNKFIELLMWDADSYGSEKYSWDTGINIKRGYDTIGGGTSKGMIWGLGMKPSSEWANFWSESITNSKGEVIERLSEHGRLRMTTDEKKALDNYIKNIIKKGYMRIDIIKMVEQNRGVIINPKYLSVNFRDIN